MHTETPRTMASRILARAAATQAANRAILRRASQRETGKPGAGEAKGADLVRRIADDMRDIAAVKGSCETEDLVLRGWTRETLRRHMDAARDRANAASVRVI